HNKNPKEKGNGFKFSPITDIKNQIAACVTARCLKMGVDDYYIQEPVCVAMRGRNPENPSDRTAGSPTEQRLEANSQGITNTITSVQKDNMIIELNKCNEKESEANAREVLRVLLKAVSKKAIEEWGTYVTPSLQQNEILQQG